ncbi:integrase core domain-containing protein [Streptomyces sp. NPDC086549]|uniref:integrase core domain-containing protein n=1 Tax=Streptomyces sp. NPDC086549 TaxID=3365752 RepID=UPI0038220907
MACSRNRSRAALPASVNPPPCAYLTTSGLPGPASRCQANGPDITHSSSVAVRQFMSAVGNSADNALAESFNAMFKRETRQGRKSWSSKCEARLATFRWLHRHNTRRRHSRLGYRSPIAYETASETTSTTLAPAA